MFPSYSTFALHEAPSRRELSGTPDELAKALYSFRSNRGAQARSGVRSDSLLDGG